MKILIITIGSAGDVHPFIGLGKELKRRGHQVSLITGDYFSEDVRRAGLDFVPLFSTEKYGYIMDHPDLWDPVRGFRLLYRDIFVPLTAVAHKIIGERYRPGEAAVVASSLAFGALTAREKMGVPVVSVHLQPVIFWSAYETPVFPGLRLGRGVPKFVKRFLFGLMNRYIDSIITPGLDQFRISIGLRPVRNILRDWLHSPDGVLGLFPDWFAPPQPDWPRQVTLSGFPLYDGGVESPLAPELDAFLDAGPPPVVFTAGSGNRQGRWFFQAAAEACRQLKCRGIFASGFRDQVPGDLPPEALYAEYAPFSALFPRAKVVVHHGGIGTTAQVLAAGVPQLIMPISFDQPDQAERINRLGVGRSIARKEFKGPKIAEILKEIMDDAGMAERARTWAEHIDGPAAIAASCDYLEKCFRRDALKV